MKMVIICSLFIITVAATASAGDSAVVLANVGSNLPLHKQITALPPVVSETYEYYNVQGGCEKDLLCQMKQKGITWNDGKKYESVTSWHLKWAYGYDRMPQACTPDSFLVTVEIVTRLPRWMRTGDVPPSLEDKWESYMKHLVAHETGHRDMAVDAAAELSREVAALPPSPSCADLDRQIQTLCRVRMKKLNDDEKQYDSDTKHGYTQGAIFR